MAQEETLTVRGRELKVTREEFEIEKLKFYLENPRVYNSARIGIGNRVPTEKEVQDALAKTEDVKALKKDVEYNGGLTDPVIVRQDNFEVIEGNRRLAAYLELHEGNPSDNRWKKIKCVLVHDATDSEINSILGQYHLKGKKEWKPYEQAGFIYRRNKEDKLTYEEISKEHGITRNKVESLIKVYDFMQKHGESKEPDRWSYYYSYLTTRNKKGKGSVSKARKENPELDELIVKKIRSKEIKSAMDLRDKLPFIVGSRKAFNSFLKEESTFNEAWARVESTGSTDNYVVQFRKFRLWLVDNEPKIRKELDKEDDQTSKKLRFEVRRAKKIVNKLKTD